jgi:hypothetical protein
MVMPRPQRKAIARTLANDDGFRAKVAALGLGLCCLHCSSDSTKKGVTTDITEQDSGKKSGHGTGPVVIDSVRCGAMLDDNLASPFTMVDDRKVFVDYPCDLEAGSPVTFVLNLHGTQSVEDGKHYIREYNKLGENSQKYGFVVATPISIGSQWGRGDNGQDAPYLAHVVDWVYSSFSGYDINQMWVTGHSWGAAYSLEFVCKPEYEDKIRGLLFMSGGASLPMCADRLSIIATVGETDIVPGQPDQSTIAAAHGCDPRSERMMGQDKVSEWANCDRGWVHQDYLMLGKGHGFNPIDWPDADMTTAIAEAVHATQPE